MEVLVNLGDVFTLNLARKSLAGIFVVVDLVLVAVFYTYAFLNRKAPDNALAVRACGVLGTYFLGRLIIQTWGWLNFNIPADGIIKFGIGWSLLLPFIGTLLAVFGAASIAIVLTPRAWRIRVWTISFVISLLFLILTYQA